MDTFDLLNPALKALTLEDIAKEAGIPLQSLKQYRQAAGTAGHRKASRSTEAAILKAVITLAARQVKHFDKLSLRAQRIAARDFDKE